MDTCFEWLARTAALAAKAYERAIALEPKALEPRHGILLPLLADRRFAEAKKHVEAALVIAPQDFTALSKLGWIGKRPHVKQSLDDITDGRALRHDQQPRAGLARRQMVAKVVDHRAPIMRHQDSAFCRRAPPRS